MDTQSYLHFHSKAWDTGNCVNSHLSKTLSYINSLQLLAFLPALSLHQQYSKGNDPISPPAQQGIRALHTCHMDGQSWEKTSPGVCVPILSYPKHPGLPPDGSGVFTQQVVCPGTPAFNSLMSCFHCTPNTLISSFAKHLWIQNFYLIKTWLALLLLNVFAVGKGAKLPVLKSAWHRQRLPAHPHAHSKAPIPHHYWFGVELMFFSSSHDFQFVQLTHCHQLHSCSLS